MEEKEKGVILEEALEEVAGGLNIDKEALKKKLKIAGVVVVGAATLGAGAYGINELKKSYERRKSRDMFRHSEEESEEEGKELQTFLGSSASTTYDAAPDPDKKP